MLFKDDKIARQDAETIRRSVGWYRWTHDLVEVTGPDALEVLEKLYVSRISAVPAGRTKYTTMLDEQGEIIDDVIVMHMSEDLFWVSTLYGPRLLPWLEAHAEGKKVSARLITDDWDMYAVQGPDSLVAMEKLLDKPLGEMKRFSVAAGSIDGIPVYVHRSGFTGENGFEIYCSAADTAVIRAKITEAVEAAGGREAGAFRRTRRDEHRWVQRENSRPAVRPDGRETAGRSVFAYADGFPDAGRIQGKKSSQPYGSAGEKQTLPAGRFPVCPGDSERRKKNGKGSGTAFRITGKAEGG